MSACQACVAALDQDTRFCRTGGSPTELRPDVVASRAAVAVMPSPKNTESKTMETNVVGALAYLAGLVIAIVFFVLDPYESNSFVRVHAVQSILFNVTWVAFWIIWAVPSAVLTHLSAGVFGLIALILVFAVAGFGTRIFLIYQAYQQKLLKLPIVSKFAAEHAGVRL